MTELPIDPSSQDYDDETGELDPESFSVPDAFSEAWEELAAEKTARAEDEEREA